MAVTCCYRPCHIVLHKSAVLLKPVSKVWNLQGRQFPVMKKTLSLQIRSSSIKNKVFEDQSEGVICRVDENGELICEGYDEGPRYHHHEFPNFSRESEIMDLLLQQNCLQILKSGGGLDQTNKLGDLTVNGFNTFC